MFGLTVEEASGAPAEFWPDHIDTLDAFLAMGTQWRVGPGGATGMDYGALPAVLGLLGTAKKKWPAVFSDLRVMEAAALQVMHAKD